jgi:hypothetical protein
MSTIENQVPRTEVDLTKLIKKEESKVNILPPALLAAKALNKKNTIGMIEVELPIMNVKVKCNAMSGVDDLTIKTISGSVSAYTDLNFSLIYKHLEFPEGHPVKSFEQFKLYCTEADFRTALFGIMLATFITLEESKFVCKNAKCPNPDPDKIYSLAIKMKDIKIEYQKEHYVSPNSNHTMDIFIAESDKININYKFECIEDKINYFSVKSNEEIRQNILTYGAMIPKNDLTINYIDSITVFADDEKFTLQQPGDILLFLNTLNLTSKEEIEKINSKFIQHIDSWIPKFSTKLTCPHCNTSHDWEDIDIYVEFFRKFTNIFQ